MCARSTVTRLRHHSRVVVSVGTHVRVAVAIAVLCAIGAHCATLPEDKEGWFLGAPGQSCDDVCRPKQLPCHQPSLAAVSTTALLDRVVSQVGLTERCREYARSTRSTHPAFDSSTFYDSICYLGNPNSQCSATDSTSRRMCCCSEMGCKFDCALSSWSEWTACVSDCPYGAMTRTRTLPDPGCSTLHPVIQGKSCNFTGTV